MVCRIQAYGPGGHQTGLFWIEPEDEIKANAGKKRKLKQHLEATEYISLLKTPCLNEQVREAFIFCCYKGLRWVDDKSLNWCDMGTDTLKASVIQKKGEPVILTLYPIAKAILDKRKERFQVEVPAGRVCKLPKLMALIN